MAAAWLHGDGVLPSCFGLGEVDAGLRMAGAVPSMVAVQECVGRGGGQQRLERPPQWLAKEREGERGETWLGHDGSGKGGETEEETKGMLFIGSRGRDRIGFGGFGGRK
uniref:Uncharacterized protein n=1 Tax=Oryza punctata TaxID=4537 RepID=A0A0E0LBD7_ORYPU